LNFGSVELKPIASMFDEIGLGDRPPVLMGPRVEGANVVSNEPALQSTAKVSAGQEDWRTKPESVASVVQVEARLVGLLADRVLDILSFEASQVQPVPQIACSSRVDFLSGLVTIDGTMIALVDLPNLLAERSREDATDAAA
jgi:hypothetical protein